MLRHRPKLTKFLWASIVITAACIGVLFFAVKAQRAGVKSVATPEHSDQPIHTLIPLPNTSPPLLRYPQLGGDFTLTNTEGQLQAFNSLKGSLVLLTFGFTACMHTCPMTLAKLARLRHELSADDQKKVRIVFVNVDPQVTLPDLKKYLSVFEPKESLDVAIVGFTGTHEDLQKVAKQYGATFFENDHANFANNSANFANNSAKTNQPIAKKEHATKKADAITHTDRIFLIDTTQTIRKIYPKEVSAKEVIEDIQTLIKDER